MPMPYQCLAAGQHRAGLPSKNDTFIRCPSATGSLSQHWTRLGSRVCMGWSSVFGRPDIWTFIRRRERRNVTGGWGGGRIQLRVKEQGSPSGKVIYAIAAMHSQTAVAAYLESKQLPLFGCARQAVRKIAPALDKCWTEPERRPPCVSIFKNSSLKKSHLKLSISLHRCGEN